jgi:hypothetical protein
MPVAAIGAGLGAAGLASSAAGGKKAQSNANKLAQQELGLQQQQFGLAKQQLGYGNMDLSQAANWYKNLLAGGPAAQQATGPYASLLGQAYSGARQGIQAFTPRGGEQNLALAQNYNQQANDIARLYAGMQPLAAQGLTGIGSAYLGSGAQFNPQASPYAAMAAYQMGGQNAMNAGTGFGNLLYNSINKLQQGGNQIAPGASY